MQTKVTLFLLVLCSTIAFGQREDLIFKTDNTLIKGNIIEVIGDTALKVSVYSENDEKYVEISVNLKDIHHYIKDKKFYGVDTSKSSKVFITKNSIWESGYLFEKGGKQLRNSLLVFVIGGAAGVIVGSVLLIDAGLVIIGCSGVVSFILQLTGTSNLINGSRILQNSNSP